MKLKHQLDILPRSQKPQQIMLLKNESKTATKLDQLVGGRLLRVISESVHVPL